MTDLFEILPEPVHAVDRSEWFQRIYSHCDRPPLVDPRHAADLKALIDAYVSENSSQPAAVAPL